MGRTWRPSVRSRSSPVRLPTAEIDNELNNGLYVVKARRDQLFGDYVVEILESEMLETSTLYQHTKGVPAVD